jgi:hypothetical protein
MDWTQERGGIPFGSQSCQPQVYLWQLQVTVCFAYSSVQTVYNTVEDSNSGVVWSFW